MRSETRRTIVLSRTKSEGTDKGRALREQEVRFRAEISLGESVRIRHVFFWHPPVCLNCKSESGCKYGDKCRFRHVEADAQPSKKVEDKWCERISSLVKGVCTIELRLEILIRENRFVLREERNLGSNHFVKFSKGTWRHTKKSGKKGSIARRHSEVVKNGICAGFGLADRWMWDM